MMQAAEIKRRADLIIGALPDDPKEAMTVCALTYANVAVSTGCDDESAVEAVRCALRQMRERGKHHDA